MHDDRRQITLFMPFLGFGHVDAAWLSRAISDVCCPFAARDLCTNSYEDDDENRSDQRGDHPHREVRSLSKRRARALGRLDPKCQTRAVRTAGTSAENDCIRAGLSVARQLEPHADRVRPTRVDHDCGRHETQPSSRRPPFRRVPRQRRPRDGRRCGNGGGSEC